MQQTDCVTAVTIPINDVICLFTINYPSLCFCQGHSFLWTELYCAVRLCKVETGSYLWNVHVCSCHWSVSTPGSLPRTPSTYVCVGPLQPSGHYIYRQFNIQQFTFCPNSVFMCFVWISEQTAIISLYSITWLVCITETECVYCAVRTGSFYAVKVYFCARIFIFIPLLSEGRVGKAWDPSNKIILSLPLLTWNWLLPLFLSFFLSFPLSLALSLSPLPLRTYFSYQTKVFKINVHLSYSRKTLPDRLNDFRGVTLCRRIKSYQRFERS